MATATQHKVALVIPYTPDELWAALFGMGFDVSAAADLETSASQPDILIVYARGLNYDVSSRRPLAALIKKGRLRSRCPMVVLQPHAREAPMMGSSWIAEVDGYFMWPGDSSQSTEMIKRVLDVDRPS